MGIKPINFGTYGPYHLRREANVITTTTLDLLWSKASFVIPGIGVYIIASKRGNKLTPWYVGKTDKGFMKRFYQHLRGNHLFPRLSSVVPDEDLVVIFLARHTAGGKLKKARRLNATTKTKAIPTIDRLEYDVLKKAHARNSALVNKSKRVYLAQLSVPGFSGPHREEDTTSANALRNLLES